MGVKWGIVNGIRWLFTRPTCVMVVRMGIVIGVLVFLCSSRCFAQILCEGRAVIPNSTFNQCNTDPWVLVFEDDFDGNTLDLSRWELQPWAQGALYGNDGKAQEYNTLDNVNVSNGTLKIIAKKEDVQRRAISWKPDDEILSDGLPNLRTYHYTSSSIWTKSKFRNGKFEARIKLPKGKGFWPAFWLFCANPWNEIDIFEFWNEYTFGQYNASKLSRVHNMTVHYDFDNDGVTNSCATDYNGVEFSHDFHIFSVVWENDKIEWMVDGVVKRTDYRYYTILGQPIGCEVFALNQYLLNEIFPRDPMAIILNLAIQNGDDAPDLSTPFPSQMEVDWVRYYQRNPCQDVEITNVDQYPIDNQIFNVIVGDDVIVSCDYSIQSGQQLDIIAKNDIILESGFNAEHGSEFSAKINSGVCDSKTKGVVSDNIQYDGDFVQKGINQIYDKDAEEGRVVISPNPNNGSFVLDFGSLDCRNYNVVITDVNGKPLSFSQELNGAKISIDLNGNAKGFYVLYLFNNQDGSVAVHRIVFQ